MDAMIEYVSKIPTKKGLDNFANEYFGIKLDARETRKHMEAEFYKQVSEGAEPLKQLPYEELLLDDEKQLDRETETQVTSKTNSGATSNTDMDEHGNMEISNNESSDTSSDNPDNSGSSDLESELSDYAQKSKLPGFDLIFKKDGVPFTVVHYTVTEALDSLKAKKLSFPEIKKQMGTSHMKYLYGLLYYIFHDGKVMVRETRNSRFITYKKEEFI